MSNRVRELREQLKRDGLLVDMPIDGVVPELVVRSWRRSISNGSAVDDSAPRRYVEVDRDSLLCRAAEPVLDRWQERLADTGTSLFLSDRAGSIVARRATDRNLLRRFDDAYAAEGFDYSEDSIGTNGLGTSIAEQRAVMIEGSQHFHESLAGVACAAAPICAPGGSVVGSISMGGAVEVANPLMLALTVEIGQQIEQRLRSDLRPQDIALAMSFTRYSNSRRPTVVMDEESLLANTPGLPYVDVSSHALLWEKLQTHQWLSADTLRFLLEGTSIEVAARRVAEGPREHFILHFTELEDLGHGLFVPPSTQATGGIGSSSRPAGAAVSASGVYVVEGPSGAGRASVAADVCPGASYDVALSTPDSAAALTSVAAMLADGKDVLLRRVEDLTEDHGRELARLIREHRSAHGRGERDNALVLTVDGSTAAGSVRQAIEGIAPAKSLLPLQETPDRIPGLVKSILDQVDPGRRYTISPAALQSLVRWTWPGNVSELHETLTALIREVPTSVIQLKHLPPHLQSVPPRRRLGMLESAEREAIIRALAAAHGNKSEAAELLGIGRTTLYRRMRQLGLDRNESSL